MDKFKFFLSNFKRLNNIIKSNRLPEDWEIPVDVNLFHGSEEEDIFKVTNHLKLYFYENKYEVDNQEFILNEIIDISSSIDVFFEGVIVNHKNIDIKNNRLMLLKNLRNIIIQYSQFSLLED